MILKKILSTLWLSIVLVSCCFFFSLFSFLTNLILRLFLKPLELSDFGHHISILWARSIIKLIPGWSATITGKENLPTQRPYVLVSNHESMTDIFVILLIGTQFRFLSKASIFKIPLFGTAMRIAGYIGVERGNPRSHVLALQQSKSTVENGRPMLFFAEGTRSKTGQLLPFKVGAFKLARDSKATIVPICLKGTRELLLKGSLTPGKTHVEVKILKPVDQNQDESVEGWAARARSLILDAREN